MAICVTRQFHESTAPPLQFSEGLLHRRVLNRTGHDAPSKALFPVGDAEERQVVPFGAAASKNNLVRLCAYEARNAPPRPFQFLVRTLSLLVDATGIASACLRRALHSTADSRVQRGCGGGVCINAFHIGAF